MNNSDKHYTKEDIWKASKHEKSLKIWAIRKMQIKPWGNAFLKSERYFLSDMMTNLNKKGNIYIKDIYRNYLQDKAHFPLLKPPVSKHCYLPYMINAHNDPGRWYCFSFAEEETEI